MKTIIYPGTFDPITNGHVDLAKRASLLFDKIIVAVAEDTTKSSIFSCDKRVELAQKALAELSGVEVYSFSGLLVNFAKEKGAHAILRGLRAVSDFEYEFQLAGMNRHLDKTIESIFLMPSAQYAYLSSSLVKEAAKLGGDISALVHKDVNKALKELFSR